MFSLEASIVPKVLLAVMLLVCLQFCFVNPWLDVLKECHLRFTNAEDRLTSLASLVCCSADQSQLPSFPSLLIQCSSCCSNTMHVSLMQARRAAVWHLLFCVL